MQGRSRLKAYLENRDIPTGKRLFIWGTGNTAALYQEGLARLTQEGFVFCGYADNNPEKWGSRFNGKKVYSPDELAKEDNVLVLLASPQPRVIRAVKKQLEEAGIPCRHIDDYIFFWHKEEILKVYDLLDDEKSKDLYEELIHCRVEGRYPGEEYVSREQYLSFHNFANLGLRDTVVDCGAYVGDTLEQYIWKTEGQFRKYIAFEPDEMNVKAMRYRVERLMREWNIPEERIEIYPYAIGDKEKLSFVERYGANNGFGSKIKETDDKSGEMAEIRCVTIDSAVKERIDYLKADIESFEYKMLLGARESIRKWKPKLAICIYHNAVDFFQLPLLVKELCPEYRLAIRHYTNLLSETILYAYTETETE